MDDASLIGTKGMPGSSAEHALARSARHAPTVDTLVFIAQTPSYAFQDNAFSPEMPVSAGDAGAFGDNEQLFRECDHPAYRALPGPALIANPSHQFRRLETDQGLAQGRVNLATVDVTIRHPGDGAEAKITERFAVSAREGFSTAKAAGILLVTLVLRAGPTLVRLGRLAFAIVLAARRARRIPKRL